MNQPEFDVFLAHNSLDKPQVIEIARYLKQNSLNPWLDQEQILGGDTILEQVFHGIKQSKTGAFFISTNGLGNFQENIELYTVINWFLRQQQNRQNFRVIPILLPGVINVPERIEYLAIWRWIQFTKSNDLDALDDLIRSIKGRDTEVKAQPVIQPPDTPVIIQPQSLIIPEQQSKPDEGVERLRQQQETDKQRQREQTNDDLSSEKDINYTKLRDLLAAKNWKEADKETYWVMIKAVGKKDGDYFSTDELENFPCTDLRTIDRLWVKYSNGDFGFSVQKKIYLSVGGKADGTWDDEAWFKFGDRVGWRVNSSWINLPLLASLAGHFPIPPNSPPGVPCIWGAPSLGLLFSRIETCKF